MIRFFLCFLLVLPSIVIGQPANTEISKGPIFEGEPYLAINPTNPDNIVAAWMSFKLIWNPVTIVTRASFDGGITWNDTVLLPHMNAKWQSADVSMAWRNDGVLFISYIDYLDSSNTDGGVFVVSSTDGGRTFSLPVQALTATEDTDVSLDRPWIAVNNSNGPTKGYLYICTKPAPWNPLPNHTYVTRSTDGGMHWSPEAVLDSGKYSSLLVGAPMGAPAVASDGTLSIAYPYFSGLSAGFALAQSHDGGVSFTRSAILTPVEDLKEKDSIKGGYHLIADPTNANHLVFAWPDARDGDYDVFAAVSMDGGATWPYTARVNDDSISNGVVQDMVWPTFGPNGELGIVWRDRRNGSKTGYAALTDSYASFSTDGGLSWTKNVRLSDSSAPYNPALVRPGNDFLSASIANDTLSAAWADLRTGFLKIYFARVPFPVSESVLPTSEDSNSSITLIPNPAKNEITISFTLENPSDCTIAFYDEKGTQLRTLLNGEFLSGTHSDVYPLTGLPDGDYFIELQTGGSTQRAKLTVHR